MPSGPALTLTLMQTRARLLAQDTDASNPGLTDAQYLSLINQRYLHYFRKIEPRVSWVAATTNGLTLATNTRSKAITDASVTTRIDEVVGIFDEGSDIGGLTATRGRPLQRASIEELLAESVYQYGGTADTGARAAPSRYTVLVVAAEPLASISPSLRGAVTIYFDRYTPFTRYYSIMLRRSPTKLSAATDTPDVTPKGSHIIASLAAYDAARLLGGSARDQSFMEGILKFIPQDIQERMNVARGERDPVVTGGKARV